ncbi:MAG TPA: Na/Pi symporter [Pirellulales bacterium]|jgi:phosphate:Na+ symporter
MNELAEFVLGLGIFFVGLQMVGEHLRQLSGPGFRTLIARFTAARGASAALGLAAGLLMQSATGVTFLLTNMVAAGLLDTSAALPVILWTNVGLTALAFVVTLDIHPLVAWSIGLCGAVATLVRQRGIRQGANVLLGVALLLFGLQSMGAAAGPLAHTDGLQTTAAHLVASPAIAFLAGFVLAAVMQSNTGATLLVITLATGGLFDLPTAAMLIYGTNLGTIVLRQLLSIGLRGAARQLVRSEDLFCLASGLLMVALFYLERLSGLPLALSAVRRATPSLALQLALVFLLSNLLPALVLSFFQGTLLRLVAWRWPADVEANAAQPKFLTARSLDDPVTAVDLIPRELARLLASLRQSVEAHRAGTDNSAVEDQRAIDYALLARRIDDYAAQLATAPLQKSVAERLNVARELTAVVGYLEAAYAQARSSHHALRRFPGTEAVRDQVLSALDALLAAAIVAVDTRQAAAITQLREQSRYHSALVEPARQSCVRGTADEQPGEHVVAQRAATLKLLADFELITWMIHRLAKLLEQLNPPTKIAATKPEKKS